MLGKRRCCCGGPCSFCAIVKTCGGTPVAGATVTFKQSGTTVATCTTAASGSCCGPSVAGSYNVSVTKTGMVGSNKDVTVACPGTTLVTLGLDTIPTTTFDIRGCNFALGARLPDSVVTVGGGTYITASTGLVAVALPVGTYPYSITHPSGRFDDASGSITVSSCSNSTIGITLVTKAGYVCYQCSGFQPPYPVKETLNFTESHYGLTGTVVWNASTLTWDDPPTLAGTPDQFVDVPAAGTCAAATHVSLRLRVGFCNTLGVAFREFLFTEFNLTGCPRTYAIGLPEAASGLTVTSAGFSPDLVVTFSAGPDKLFPGVTSTVTVFE